MAMAKFFSRNLVIELIWQLLSTLPLALLGVAYSIEPIKTWLDKFSVGWQITYCVILLIIPIITNISYKYYQQKKANSQADILSQLIEHLGIAVDFKRRRFANVLSKAPKSDQTIFKDITQPKWQMEKLCTSICIMMGEIVHNKDIKLSLIRCKKEQLMQYLSIIGDDKETVSVKELSEHSSLAKYVLKHHKTVIIEDVLNKPNNIPFYANEGCNIRSILQKPLMVGNEVCLLLSLSSHTEKTFRESRKKEYDKILDIFCYRLLLERHLLELKNTNHNEYNQQSL